MLYNLNQLKSLKICICQNRTLDKKEIYNSIWREENDHFGFIRRFLKCRLFLILVENADFRQNLWILFVNLITAIAINSTF